ncbi:MAG: hypothetical protein P9L94_11055 [Candidatus Hinthialibacter antarcticus]|nr:hypothetical protein [Candidatus Hinthialibacter antarcticus]
MNSIRLILPCLLLVFGLTTQAQNLTPIAEINTCDEMGMPTFAGISTQDRYAIEGVALNDADIFNGFDEASGVLDSSLILFVQDGTGGIQIYSGAWYNGGLAIYPVIQQGERVRVTGLTGFFGGKTNINDRHNKDQTFAIERLGETALPAPIEIDDLEAAQQFDPSRASGGEFYQGRLVKLMNVHITEGEWSNGGFITVANEAGQTFPVELCYGTQIADHPQPEGSFNLIGVFNQEDTTDPPTGDYLLWPRSIDDFQSPQSAMDDWHVYR